VGTRLAALAALTLLAVCGGCRSFSPERAHSQLDQGYTILLPGVLGHAPWDDNLAAGLTDAGVSGAIEVYDWTRGPWMWAQNVLDSDSQREQGEKIAAKIVDYQNRYPGRPVHLIGHSGGGWTTVCALEALPPDRRVTSALLLASGLPTHYDLRKALSRTELGIHNYYSPYDLLLSVMYLPTRAFHPSREVAAAGAFGFQTPSAIQGQERQWYEQSLKQHGYEFEMFDEGHIGDHFGWTNPTFVAQWIAPVLKQSPFDVKRLPQPGALESQTAEVVPSSAPLGPPPPPPPRPPQQFASRHSN
jgi:pimeloyl-ACP methyl ester carboxylesterase